MLVAAAEALKAQSPALKDPNQPLLPDVQDVREISVDIAAGVIKCSVAEGLSQQENIPHGDSDLKQWIRERMWEAVYQPLIKA